MRQRAREDNLFSIVKSKLSSAFHVSVLLLTMNFVITLSKVICGFAILPSAPPTDLNIKVVFSSFKIGIVFGVKDLIAGGVTPVHVWFTRLHVQVLMPATSAKPSGIFPHV